MLSPEQKQQLKDILIQYNPLYYEIPSFSLEQNFSKYPGQPKVNRILTGKSSIFYTGGDSPNKQKRTIVISDWTIFSADKSFSSAAKEILEILIKEGFNVRVWNGESLVTINQAQIEKTFIVKSGSEEKINQKLAEENIFGDAIFHLNYFEMRKILDRANVISHYNFCNLSSTDNILELSDLIKFNTIPEELFNWLKTKKFILHISDPLNTKKITNFLSDFSENIIGIKIDRATDPSIFKELLKLPNLQEISWTELPTEIDAKDWEKNCRNMDGKFPSKLKKLIFYNSSIPSYALSQLIERSDYLTEITIAYCKNLQDLKFSTNKNHFKQLKSISIYNSNIDGETISSIITKATSIESLHLSNVTFNGPDNIHEQLNENSFISLTYLNFFGIKNGGELLKFILNRSRNIEKLIITNCHGLQNINVDNLANSIFLKLKVLSLNETDVPAKTLAKLLLLAASQIEQIDLTKIKEIENFTPDLIDDAVVFKQLKNCKGFPLGTYLKIISISPRITTIDLSCDNHLSEAWHSNSLINLEQIDLLKIAHVDVHGSDIEGKVLGKLLSVAKNIISINFKFCENIADLKPEDIPDDLIFNNLTHIYAEESAIRGDTLAKIISRSPNLRMFSIDKCKNIETFNLSTYIKEVTLLKFETYTAAENNLSLKEHLALLSCCPNFSCLDLGSVNLDDEIDEKYLSTLSLEHITSIIVPNANNVGKIFGKLLKQTKNLKNLQLININLPCDKQEFIINESFKNMEIVDWKNSEIPAAFFWALTNSLKIQKISIAYCRSSFVYNHKMPLTSLSALTELNLKNFSFDSTFVADLIERGEHLEKIILSAKSSQSFIFDRLVNSGKPLHNLTHLELENLTLPGDFLKKIHILFPKLETLILKNCLGLNIDKKDLDLKSKSQNSTLKKLVINKSDISNTGIKRLIINQPELRQFEMTHCFNVSDISFTENEFSKLSQKLETIVTTNTAVSRKTYQWFFNQPNLIEMKLHPSNNIESDANLSVTKLEMLEELDLNYSTMSFNLFITLISKTKKLKALNIKNIKLTDIPESFNYSSIQLLKTLKKIDISDSPQLPLELILTLLDSSEVSSVNFYSYDYIGRGESYNTHNLSSINSISFHSTHLPLDSFFTLLSSATNLEKIDIINWTVISDEINRNILKYKYQLNKLETINIASLQDFNGEVLLSLLIAGSNSLKLINIENSHILNLSADLIPNDLYLPNLESFTFDTSFDDPEQLAFITKLKACAPNLKADPKKTATTKNDKQNYSNVNHKRSNRTTSSLKFSEPNLNQKDKQSSSKINHVKDNFTDLDNYNNPHRFKKNTNLPKEIFAKEIFVTNYNLQNPAPRDFRFGVYPSVEEMADGWTLKPSTDRKLHDIKYERSSIPLRKQFQEQIQKNSDDCYALCETDFILSEEWRPLPSLHSHDEQLLYFYTDSSSPYEIQYSEEDNLYYIRKTTNGKDKILDSVDTKEHINISLILQLPKDVKNKLGADLPEEIDSLIKECNKRESGTCVQRSIAFHNKFRNILNKCKEKEKYKNYKSRIILNKIHAFVEIFDGKIWKKGPELGGANVDLKVKKMDFPKLDLPKRKNNTKTKQNKPSNVIKPAEKKPEPKKITEAELCSDFVTWKDKKENIFKSPEELLQRIVVAGNHQINIENPDDCLKIMAEFSKLNKPYLFIDSPDDLQWRAPGLKFKESNNLGIQGKFSKVRYFIEQYPNGVLFINWSNFKHSDIVALHSIIDPERILEEEPLPQSLSIVSFLATNVPNPYKDSDFTSRSIEYTWNFKIESDLYKNRTIKLDSPLDDGMLAIDLYESEDWEILLFGFIQIQKKQFSLDRNNFLESLEHSAPLKSIHLKNPPWHLRSFQLFWQDALQQNQFSLYGKTFHLDKEFKLFYSTEYNWHLDLITDETNENAFAYPLNQHTYYKFFPHYSESSEDGFKKELGLLQKYGIVTLVVTEKITEQQWCRLLAEAKKLNVKIRIELGDPNIELPIAMEKVPKKKFESDVQVILEHKNLEVLDQMPYAVVWAPQAAVEVTKGMLKRYPDALYINLDSTHDFSDLFYQIKASMNEEEILAEFVKSYPWRALSAGQTVIIEGSLPRALINALSSMFISGKLQINDQEKVPAIGNQIGKLIFVTDTPITYAKNKLICNMKPHQVSELFSNKKTGKEEIEDDEHEKEKNNKKDKNLTTSTIEIQKTDSEDLSFKAYKAYEDRRFQNIQEGFLKSPLIFYTGPTGIGKTEYLTKEFEQDYLTRTGRKAKLYIGESAIEAFAAHVDENVDPFLLIDEADLSNTKLSFLKSIKDQKKPHLLINGNYYHTPRHKVFFVGNGKKYGGARQQSEFFEEHTEPVSCERPTQAYLYHKIIQSKLLKNFSAKESAEIAKTILNIFNKINEIVGSVEPLLSPRHLHIVTVLFNAYTKQTYLSRAKRNNLICTAFIDVIGKRLKLEQQQKLLQFLKEKHKYEKERIEELKKNYIKEKLSKINKKTIKFSFTESRYPILQILDTFLNLRNQEDFHFGILLEGASGTGKSTLIKNYLKLLGIPFIQFSWGKNYETDLQILLQAYFQGKAILLDELNANGPKYERLINTIIMKNDDELIQIANEVYGVNFSKFNEEFIKNKKPGCLIISTQNSISMSGRQALSTAVQARFTPLDIPEYTGEELLQILQDLGVKKESATSAVNSYIVARDYAEKNSLNPKPNLRNLLRSLGVEEKFVENNTQEKNQEENKPYEKEGKQEETEKPNETLKPTSTSTEPAPTVIDSKISKEEVSDNTKEEFHGYNKKFIAEITVLIREIESKQFAQDEDLKHDKLAILNFLKECVEKINPTYLALMIREITACKINNFSSVKQIIESSFVGVKLTGIIFNKQYRKNETIYSLLKSQRRNISQFFPIFPSASKSFIDRYSRPSSEEIYNKLTESETTTEQSNSYKKYCPLS